MRKLTLTAASVVGLILVIVQALSNEKAFTRVANKTTTTQCRRNNNTSSKVQGAVKIGVP